MTPTTVAPDVPTVDALGRLIPMTEAEVRARAVLIARELDALDEIGDEEEQRATLELLEAAEAEGLALRSS